MADISEVFKWHVNADNVTDALLHLVCDLQVVCKPKNNNIIAGLKTERSGWTSCLLYDFTFSQHCS
jgi:hypothetical protein